MSDLSLEQLMRLLWFIGAYDTRDSQKPQKIGGLYDVATAAIIVDAAAGILLNWPAGFHAFLDRLSQRSDKASSGSNRLGPHFGWFYPALYRTFNDSGYAFLFRGFEDYIQKHWTGQLAGRNRRLSSALRTDYEWMPLAHAAKQLGVSRSFVKLLINRGLLEGKLYETKGHRQMGAVRCSSVDALRIRKATWISLKAARQVLGASRKSAHRLIETGVLKPISGPTVDGRSNWLFERHHVATIADGLAALGQR